MGEISEMMLDGTLCQQYGVYMGGTCDYPRTCGSCKRDEKMDAVRAKGQQKVHCPICAKFVKRAGLKDHQRDAHGIQPTPKADQPVAPVPVAPPVVPPTGKPVLSGIAGELLTALESLVRYDGYETEYDGRMYTICPDCGKQDGEHSKDCAFEAARALIAKVGGA